MTPELLAIYAAGVKFILMAIGWMFFVWLMFAISDWAEARRQRSKGKRDGKSSSQQPKV